MCIVHIGSATRSADSSMRDVDVHDEPWAANQFRDVCGCKEILITVMDSRHVQTNWIQGLDPHGLPIR